MCLNSSVLTWDSNCDWKLFNGSPSGVTVSNIFIVLLLKLSILFQFCGWNLAKNVNIVGLSLNNRVQGASPVIKRLNTGIITKSGVGILNTDDNSIHVYTKIVNEIWWNYSQKLIIWGGINSLTHYRGTAVVYFKTVNNFLDGI